MEIDIGDSVIESVNEIDLEGAFDCYGVIAARAVVHAELKDAISTDLEGAHDIIEA